MSRQHWQLPTHRHARRQRGGTGMPTHVLCAAPVVEERRPGSGSKCKSGQTPQRAAAAELCGSRRAEPKRHQDWHWSPYWSRCTAGTAQPATLRRPCTAHPSSAPHSASAVPVRWCWLRAPADDSHSMACTQTGAGGTTPAMRLARTLRRLVQAWPQACVASARPPPCCRPSFPCFTRPPGLRFTRPPGPCFTRPPGPHQLLELVCRLQRAVKGALLNEPLPQRLLQGGHAPQGGAGEKGEGRAMKLQLTAEGCSTTAGEMVPAGRASPLWLEQSSMTPA